MILQRSIHVVKRDKWDEFVALEKQIDALLIKAGIPPRRRYQPMIGGLTNIQVVEREWESLAALEASRPRWDDPELQRVQQQAMALIESSTHEVYQIL